MIKFFALVFAATVMLSVGNESFAQIEPKSVDKPDYSGTTVEKYQRPDLKREPIKQKSSSSPYDSLQNRNLDATKIDKPVVVKPKLKEICRNTCESQGYECGPGYQCKLNMTKNGNQDKNCNQVETRGKTALRLYQCVAGTEQFFYFYESACSIGTTTVPATDSLGRSTRIAKPRSYWCQIIQ